MPTGTEHFLQNTVLGLQHCSNHEGPENVRNKVYFGGLFYWTKYVFGKGIKQAFQHKVPFFTASCEMREMSSLQAVEVMKRRIQMNRRIKNNVPALDQLKHL